jgi:hypothetical protein
MAQIYSNELKPHIIYLAYDEVTDDTYIGSSGLPIERLEYNHRNWMSKGYDATNFRQYLSLHNDNVKFVVAEEIVCTRAVAELIEQEWITLHSPSLNIDKKPFNHSCLKGRIRKGDVDDAIDAYMNLKRPNEITGL